MRFFIAALLLALAACDGGEPLKAGDPAPAFVLERLDGTPARFPDDFKGRPVSLRFWADWCPYCREEMQDIERVYQEYSPRGLEILAVNVGQDAKTAGDFARKIGITYPVLLDLDSAVSRKYRVIGLPMTLMIDGDGVIQSKILGETDVRVFEDMVKAMIQ